MGLKPRHRSGVVPPGGYVRYRDPDDGWEYEHPYYDVVKEKAWAHRKEARLEIPVEWDEFFDDQFCKAVPQACVDLPEVPTQNQSTPSKTKMAIQFAQSMLNWAMSGFQVSSYEDFQSRWEQCAGSKEHGIPRCEHLASWTAFGIPRCAKCGCVNKLKLWVKTERCPIGKW